MQNIAEIRKEYKKQTLLEKNIDPNPFIQFNKWWDEAVKSELEEVNAMTLATASVSGVPSARIVLLKGADEKGFVFFTNYDSHKGRELAQNPLACLVLFWAELERQVRIEGVVEKISEAESDEYFASRPQDSRIGAWASEQSSIIEAREIIEERAEQYRLKFTDGNIPRPPHWGGYIVKSRLIEFWQGRASRLHDRLQYTLQDNGAWKIERLAP